MGETGSLHFYAACVRTRGFGCGPRERHQIPILAPDPWTPTNTDSDQARESKLLEEMQNTINKFKFSRFYLLVDQQLEAAHPLQDPLKNKILSVQGSKPTMVAYSIGPIESDPQPRLQLSLSILLAHQGRSHVIHLLEVFHPVLSSIKCRVIVSLGCAVLSVNEHCRCMVTGPTLFFMPHCCRWMIDNLFGVNWSASQLNRIAVLGNNFRASSDLGLEFLAARARDEVRVAWGLAWHAQHMLKAVMRVVLQWLKLAPVVGVGPFLMEAGERLAMEVRVSGEDDWEEEFALVFRGLSWHLFELDPDVDLRKRFVCDARERVFSDLYLK
ncbi:hypothetical protein QJS04_geneDACA020642 [Acorus gramineus]|uniref:SRR1-like domain-containing protein n=1 Tax=Acorus gramineus TaxID=55184 RepID=A0AAV9BD00_ACOGR|nr:hypothetical protein QJS04_geneDACA020642 [Acorus gramineus]